MLIAWPGIHSVRICFAFLEGVTSISKLVTSLSISKNFKALLLVTTAPRSSVFMFFLCQLLKFRR